MEIYRFPEVAVRGDTEKTWSSKLTAVLYLTLMATNNHKTPNEQNPRSF